MDRHSATRGSRAPWGLGSYRHSINGIYVLAEYAANAGVPTRALLAGTGLEPADLRDPMLTVSAQQEIFFFLNLVDRIRDPLLGLKIGARYRLSAFGALGMLLMSSPDLRTAFDLILRHFEHVYGLLIYELREKEGEAILSIREHAPLGRLRRFMHDREISGTHQVFSDLIGRPLPLRSVHCAYREPADAEPYRAHFGCPVHFGRTSSRLIFDAQWLDHPLPQANPLTAALFEERLRAPPQRSASGPYAKRVADYLRARSGARPRLPEVAASLRTTPRTVLRRLRAEGTSYRAVARQTQEDLAQHYLDSSRLTLSEIAARLGFADASAFSHAYRTWTGSTPGARRRAAGPALRLTTIETR